MSTHSYERLILWVTPNDVPSYQVDLSQFANGGRKQELRGSSMSRWGGDYTGRPRFAMQISDYFRLTTPGPHTANSVLTGLRALFRFLDITHPEAASVSDLTDAHGVQFKAWLETEGKSYGTYKALKGAVERIRQLEGLPPLWWPARSPTPNLVQDDVDLLGVRRLFHALKGEGREIKAMFREGSALQMAGRDPRGVRFDQGNMCARWEFRENHAWLIDYLTKEYIPNQRGFKKEKSLGLVKSNYDYQYHLGPAYLAPGMTERGREGIVGKLRWFHPSYHDTAVLLWLFLLGTGWNLAAALSVDVSADEQWFDDHPHKPEFKVLHAFKGRADKHVFALSLGKPEWHPYQIIRFMIERTRALRETIRRRLVELEKLHGNHPSPASASEIEHLRADLRSPWLYHCVNRIGQVSAFGNNESRRLNSLVRTVAKRANLLEEHPSLVQMATSTARDAWIGFAYVKSGHNVVLTQLAAQHANAATLRHYLGRRRYRKHSEAVIRKVQDIVFSEIENKRIVDATRLRILVQNGHITVEQERRLLDLRYRTRLGMGCLDPTNPPRDVAPGHPLGAVCAVQRCTGCVLGVVFAESIGPLARAKAELMQLRRELPLAAWIGSSFEDEAASIDATLAQFPAEEVDKAVATWFARIQNGEAVVHDTYPSY
jgi:hypothetical protein